MSLFIDLVVTGSLCYYLRALNPSRGLGQTKKMLSTIVNFADHNGVLTWFLGLFLRKRSLLTRIVNSLVTLASLICVRMSFVLFAICVDLSDNSGSPCPPTWSSLVFTSQLGNVRVEFVELEQPESKPSPSRLLELPYGDVRLHWIFVVQYT